MANPNVPTGSRPTPPLVGLSIVAARAKVGLVPFRVSDPENADRLGPAAVVTVQRPGAGEPMDIERGVEVDVGVKVPDFRGKTIAAARAVANNLLLNLVALPEDAGPTAGPIGTQDPPKGTVVQPGAMVRVGVKGLVADLAANNGASTDSPDANRADAGSREAGVASGGGHGGLGPSGPSHEPPQVVSAAAGATDVASQPIGGVQTGPADGGGSKLSAGSVPPTIPPRSPPWLFIVLALTVVGLVITGTARWQRGSRDAERAGLNPPSPSVTIKPDLGSAHFEVRNSHSVVARSLRVRTAAEPSQPRVIGDDRGELKVTVRRTDG
jgi:hypothetical protein